jgi:hypothetical protein
MLKCLVLLSALATTVASAAPAWRWVDADGTVHYSDRPVPGATQVELPTTARPATAARTSQPGAAPVTPTTQAGPGYTRFDIVSPAQQETLWNTGGTVTVQVEVQPGLQQGHRLDLMYDGERLNLAASGASFTLNEVFRGIHTVQAVIVDGSNTVLLRSLPVQFMVQQTSLQNPNNPNSALNRPRN